MGTEPGEPLSCTAHGFEPGTVHQFRLGSFGIDDDGSWIEFHYSNIAGGNTHAREVTDLDVFTAEPTRLHLRWTQVDDGTGQPAGTA